MGNLSFNVSREELIEAFSAAGKVVDAKLPTDRETGRPRGFAFVEFEDSDAAQRSIEIMNGKDLKGRPLRVNEAENRPPRPPGSAPMRPSFGGGGGAYRGAPPPPPDFERGFGGKGDGRRRGEFKPKTSNSDFKPRGNRRHVEKRKKGFDFDDE